MPKLPVASGRWRGDRASATSGRHNRTKWKCGEHAIEDPAAGVLASSAKVDGCVAESRGHHSQRPLRTGNKSALPTRSPHTSGVHAHKLGVAGVADKRGMRTAARASTQSISTKRAWRGPQPAKLSPSATRFALTPSQVERSQGQGATAEAVKDESGSRCARASLWPKHMPKLPSATASCAAKQGNAGTSSQVLAANQVGARFSRASCLACAIIACTAAARPRAARGLHRSNLQQTHAEQAHSTSRAALRDQTTHSCELARSIESKPPSFQGHELDDEKPFHYMAQGQFEVAGYGFSDGLQAT